MIMTDSTMIAERYYNDEDDDTMVVSRNVPSPASRRTTTMTDLPPIRQNERNFLWDLYHTLNMPAANTNNNTSKSSMSMSTINWFQTEPTSGFQQQGEEDYNYYYHDYDYCNFVGIDCNNNGLVSTLDLSHWGLSGNLPSNFMPLSKLRYLILSNNSIKGVMPNLIPTSLIHWDVSHNQISGLLYRTNFGMATQNLQRIDLSNNNLSGTIPGEYNLCNLLELQALDLSNNTLINGTLPDCLATELRELHELNIRNTNLVGPVPENLCSTTSSIPSTSSEGVEGRGGNQNKTTTGMCSPFGFCTDGYREVLVTTPPDSIKNYTSMRRCQPCEGRSNRISSSICEELMVASSSPPPIPPYPTTDMATPTPLSSPLPVETVPSESPTIFVPSSSPTWPSQVNVYDRSSSSSSNPVSLFDSVTSSPVEVRHGVVGSTESDASSSSSSLRLERVVIAFILVMLLVLVLLLISVRSWRIRRKVRRLQSFLTLPDIQNIEGDHNIDEEQPSSELFDLPKENRQWIGSTGEQQPPSSFAVQRRPCIVRPGTLSSKPKVRFLLGPRTATTFGGINGSNDNSEMHFNVDQQLLAMYGLPSSSSLDHSDVLMPSFDSESGFRGCLMATCQHNPCGINGNKINGTEEVTIPTSCTPPDSFAALISKPSVDSSVSSTTPMLNSLDDGDVRIGAVPWMVKVKTSGKPDDEGEDCYNKVMPLVKDGLSSSCTMNKRDCGGREDDDVRHPNITPLSPPRPPESFGGQHDIFEGYQSLLGILPSSVSHNCTQQDDDDDGIEVIEFYGDDEKVGIPFEAPDEENFQDEARIEEFYYS